MGAVAQTGGQTSGSTGTSKSAGSTSSATKGSLDSADRKFIEEAAMGGMMEVELGKLAQQKAMNEDVKKFGEHMVQDHSKANDQLKQTVSAKGVQVPASMDKKHQGDIDKLGKLSGADFDKAYMKQMVSDHKKDVSEFQKAAKSAKDSDVKSFAASTLPTLQEHLKMAQATSDAVSKEKSSKSAMNSPVSPNAKNTGTAGK